MSSCSQRDLVLLFPQVKCMLSPLRSSLIKQLLLVHYCSLLLLNCKNLPEYPLFGHQEENQEPWAEETWLQLLRLSWHQHYWHLRTSGHHHSLCPRDQLDCRPTSYMEDQLVQGSLRSILSCQFQQQNQGLYRHPHVQHLSGQDYKYGIMIFGWVGGKELYIREQTQAFCGEMIE